MTPTLRIPPTPEPSDRQRIVDALVHHNTVTAGPSGHQAVAVLIEDPDGGGTIGGLWGSAHYDWLFVELLFVPEALRGQGFGTRLIEAAEGIARERGCTGVWLDTFEFQAPRFYRRLGYEVFGELPDYPRGGRRFWLRKFLAPQGE